MSAFTATTVHIDALLTAGPAFCTEKNPLTWHYPPPTQPNRAPWAENARSPQPPPGEWARLLAENTRSVNYRNNEDHWEPVYLFSPAAGTPDPLTVLKAIACLEYQSCEEDGWFDSEARVFCQALRRLAIAALPGYR